MKTPVQVTPTQVRFSDKAQVALRVRARKAGIKQAHLIRLAVDELFERYPTTEELGRAYARNLATKNGSETPVSHVASHPIAV